MRRVPTRTGAAAIAAGLLLGSATALTGGPAAAGPPREAAAGTTLVNGAGRTVRAPALSAATAAAGATGNAGKAPGPAALPQSRIGPTDTRYRETPTTAYPARTVVHLTSSLGECTGFMVSRDTVVTAGHCVYNHGRWATNYKAIPGHNGPTDLPFGHCTGSSGDMWTTNQWVTTLDWTWDYGAIKLTCDIGNTVGWMGWWYGTADRLPGQSFYSPGWPMDRGFGELWNSYDKVVSQTERVVEHDNDTAAGQSGGPLYRHRYADEGGCAGWCVTGIHTRGDGGGGHNWAQRYTAEVIGFIQYVANLP